ncbi:hypothetical protein [Tsukamurella pseudospumae]|uniref:DUF3298 domain-containing protein n=1 Tax=Tsukamurella pseudospumae TaxID=239498 RepID=A0A138AIK8_9ACTN|nr:hypothetical protein [Tsukamurella pseudospumae]KXP10316.1 hypothetical protein AXK60_07605 [Tsukamurella pseudospumae]
MRGGRAVVALLLAGSTVTACAGPASPPAGSTGRSGASVAVSVAPSTTSAAEPSYDFGPPGPTAAPAHGYVPGLDRRKGVDGPLTYDVQVPTLSGGAAAVTARFNASMQASLSEVMNALTKNERATLANGNLVNGERSRVTHIGSRVVAGILLTNYYVTGTAHPSNGLGTIVIDTTTAQPILLTQVFPTSEGQARVLSLVAAKRYGPAIPFAREFARDLANWVPSDEGLTVYPDVAHAAGDYGTVTIPWSELKDVVAPAMWPVVTS